MARGKHVKGRVRRPEVVEDGDRVTITNGYSAVGTGSDDRGERATGRGSRIADPAPEVLMAAASTNGHDSPDGHALGGTEPRGAHAMRGTVNRRKVLGLAAAGVAGGSVLVEGFSSPALAATTTETGAVAPAVVALTDAPTIAVNASLGNDFRVTIAASRAMGNPTNAVDGQKIVFQITQGGAGSCTITWGSLYEFSTALPQPTLSTTVGQTDLLAFIYNAALGKWLFVAFVGEFYPVPTVSKVSPNSGPVAGGTSVTITGSGFTGATSVAFGAVATTNFTVVSSTQITAVAPAQPAGLHNVFVTGPGGTSAAVFGDLFTYH
ncbi:MAG: IPT/TIG domain-containing protein [Acidimicrobiales bacterium]